MGNRFFLLLLAPTLLLGQEKVRAPSPWEPLKQLVGEWQGASKGQPGNGTVHRKYELLFGGTFLEVTNTSTYPPQEKNPKGETHHDIGLFSYDKQRQKLTFRQFHREGFVNEYVLETISPDGKNFTFVTERIENIAEGWRARESYTIVSKDEFMERFELAEPGKDFSLYSESILKRK